MFAATVIVAASFIHTYVLLESLAEYMIELCAGEQRLLLQVARPSILEEIFVVIFGRWLRLMLRLSFVFVFAFGWFMWLWSLALWWP